MTAALTSVSVPEIDVDCSYDKLSGTYNNARLDASNVWSTNVQPCLVAEAAAIFERCGLRAAFLRLRTASKKSCGEQVKCIDGECFFANHAGWKSDVGWLSADDQPTHDTFLSLFRRMGVAETFAPIVGGAVHLYSAFFVVRSACTEADLHVDYGKKVKTTALTLMTPLYEEYSAVHDFQLLYRTHDKSLRQYRYRLGEAIVFGASFYHSTEPGVAALEPTDPNYKRDPASQPLADSTAATSQQGGSTQTLEGTNDAMPPALEGTKDAMPPARRAHAYLCFSFGSDEPDHWGPISETVDGQQSRQISRPGQPNGANSLSLSKLGLRIESGATDADDAGGYGMAEGLGDDGMGDDGLKVGALPRQHSMEAGHAGGVGGGQGKVRRRLPRGMLK